MDSTAKEKTRIYKEQEYICVFATGYEIVSFSSKREKSWVMTSSFYFGNEAATLKSVWARFESRIRCVKNENGMIN